MKKNIEWLKKEIATEMIELEPNRKERWSDVKYQTLRDVAQKIYQLDEPEALSKEWVNNNVVHVRGLGDIFEAETVENLLVPKQEITYEDALKVIAENIDTDEFGVGLYIEALNNNEKYEFLTEKWIEGNKFEVNGWNEAVHVEDLENLIVPNQKLPVVPKYVGEFIEEVKASGDSLDDAFSILRGIYHQSKVADWVSKENHNSEIFARAWLDGFTVEKEQKYYVSARDEEYGGFWFLSKNNSGDISIGVNRDWSEVDWYRLKLTEREIKDYDPRYMVFAIPVEEGR